MLLVYIYVALASYNTEYLTLPLSSIETIIDDAANIATVDGKGRVERSHMGGKDKSREKRERGDRERERSIKDWKGLWSVGTDAVMDVPLGGVCEVLYGDFREEDDDED
jgi:phosphatidylinositol glycan class P protein